ncbi:glycine--tRNA ligase [Alistipes sp. CAG:831]|nr:glycine--tRNA ligase [Alistipes sp. CAG:831]
MTQEEVFKQLTAHAKEYGFVFPSSEIYDGLSAVYDYGQMGVELKNNIKKYWWDAMVRLNGNIVGIDSAIFMHPKIWQASGHVGAFNDPLIDNKDSKKRYRADVLIEDYIAKLEEKIAKEVEKGRRKFGESFDEAQFRATNPNVRRCLSGCGRGVHLDGDLALVEGALGSVAGLVLEVSGHCESLLRGGDDDLAELRRALEVLDVDAEALVQLDVGLLHVLQPSGEGEGGAFVGGE